MTFQDAINWFKSLGAVLEPGPRYGEVTMRWAHEESVHTQVVPDHMLPPMAQMSMNAHIRNMPQICGITGAGRLQ